MVDGVRISVCGIFSVETALGRLTEDDIRSDSLCRLIAYLALYRRTSQSPVTIADNLWMERDIENPYSTIKNLAYRSRRILAGALGGKALITAVGGTYRINPSLSVTLDSELADTAFAAIKNEELTDNERLEYYKKAFCCGMLSPVLSSEMWAIPFEALVTTRTMSVLFDAKRIYCASGMYDEALDCLHRVLEIDKLSEQALTGIIKIFLIQNRRSMAGEFYSRCLSAFERIKIPVSPDFIRLREEITG